MQRSFDCMARNNVKIMQPLSGDEKKQVLCKLQGSPHFEKILSASTVSRVLGKNAGMTLPSWFVQEHGDKFRQSVTLRTESSTKAWLVRLSIYFFSATWIQVRFSAGWKAFATSNGLLEGDYLVFALTAMSEFEVYVFRSTQPEGFPNSQAQIRKWTCDSERSRKKTKPSFECRDGQLVADGGRRCEGEVKFNGLNVAKTKTVADEGATSPSGPPSPTSFRNASCSNESQDDLILRKLTVRKSLLPGFWKKLTASNICRRDGGGETACLEIPLDFWKIHGNRIHSLVKLQGIGEESPVRTMACYPSHGKQSRHYLRAEWRDFVNENHLQVGQELLFTLTADSFFVVREAILHPS